MVKRRRKEESKNELAIFNDIQFPKNCPGADYDFSWNHTFCDINLFRVCLCWESAVLFAAREGWVNSVAPQCQKCIGKKDNRTGYIFQRKGRRGWSWRMPCCKAMVAILKNSMFYHSNLSPGELLQIM